jgi:two-component system, response regulator YesN
VPLRLAGAVLGVCYLDNPLSGDVFSPDDLSILQSFMSLSAIAVQNSLLREKIVANSGSKRRGRVSPLGENAVERTITFLRDNFERDIEREELEKITGLSGDHLGKIFKIHSGSSIANFVSKLRVEKAIELLRTTEEQVIDIAFTVGFQSLNTFYRVFAQVTGAKPTDYRQSK